MSGDVAPVARARRSSGKVADLLAAPAEATGLREALLRSVFADLRERWQACAPKGRLAVHVALHELRQAIEAAADEGGLAQAWDEGHRTACVYFPDCQDNGHHDPNPYRAALAEATDGVTSVEPGCTCGGMAACPQCQDRVALAVEAAGRDEEGSP